LHQCGLLTFRRRQKAKVGMFTVKKKGNRPGNTQRLIVDCRQRLAATTCHYTTGDTSRLSGFGF